MCGILGSISRAGNGLQSKDIPSCIPTLKNGCNNNVADFQFWETRDAGVIERFTTKDRSLKSLSKSDENKLSNLDQLRQLNTDAAKIRNNVKLSSEEQHKQLEQIQIRIDEITIGDHVEDSETPEETDFESLMYEISSRGPDYLNYSTFTNNQVYFQLFSSILSLRQPFQSQPIQFDRFILQFNGELYNDMCLHTNDTTFFMETLRSNLEDSRDDSEAIFITTSRLYGEYAFVLYDLKEDMIYFGRDCIGRRSLAYSLEDNKLTISSLAHSSFVECENKLYVFNLSNFELNSFSYPQLFQRYNDDISQMFKPLPYTEAPNEEESLKKLYISLKQSTLLRQQAIYPLHDELVTLGILFSGGLDCTIVASLIGENILESNHAKRCNIDLLTVGFDNPRTNQKADTSPDRQLSKKSWFHLASKYNKPDRLNIRLVEINVSYREWLMHRRRVQKLMYPCQTEMDLSIAIAFYFASALSCESMELLELTQTGISFEEFSVNEMKYITRSTNYSSTAKVLFSGLGADELFAGYSRHEAIFSNQLTLDSTSAEIEECYEKLSAELIYDINVIHRRNLGRDDRVISSWGKELRYPYLDEKFISIVINEIHPNLKFHFGFESVTSKKNKVPRIVMKPIRKYLLRQLAAKVLGLEWVKDELKRAIQFGAKSAKLEIGQSKAKGTDKLL
ncbi:glucosamine 6-phosphate synthetase [Scheffersomyces xylosifermentans]|uniref:glucosamine 6-phosphate synthetase n=1 Tax=Scheffersomyces xylosifermentans TaxID=1304137 RepID=UPI00315CAB35